MFNSVVEKFHSKATTAGIEKDIITPTSSVGTSTLSPTKHTGPDSKVGDFMRDAILGFADGLTVPFALTAGLSAVGSIRIVIVGGLAELFAGAISMGLGAWLAVESEEKAYYVEEAREKCKVQEVPDKEEQGIYEIFDQYHISKESCKGVVDFLRVNPDIWVQFMMDFELKLARPNTHKAWISALVISVAYFLGGLLPMIPYFIFKSITHALYTSIGISVVILILFGYVKAIVIGQKKRHAVISAIQMLAIGTFAAGASYGIVTGVNKSGIGGAI